MTTDPIDTVMGLSDSLLMKTDTPTETDMNTKGFKTEFHFPSGEWATNGVIWPDAKSADTAGLSKLMVWSMPDDFRVIEVAEAPNRPTWEIHCG